MNVDVIEKFVREVLVELDAAVLRNCKPRFDDETAVAAFEECFHSIDFKNLIVTHSSDHKPAAQLDRETLKKVWIFIAFGNFLREKNVRILQSVRSDH
jgi:hypothetical protein